MSRDVPQPEDDRTVLAALYAAGALTEAEGATVEARVEAGDAQLAEEIASHDRTVEELMNDVEPIEPSPGVRAELLSRIAVDEASAERARELEAIASSFVADASWEPVVIDGTPWPGVEARRLGVDFERGRLTALLRMAPGGVIPPHVHDQDEECFVVEGELRFGGQVYGAGDYFRLPEGSHHDEQTTPTGCTCLVITSLTNTYL